MVSLMEHTNLICSEKQSWRDFGLGQYYVMLVYFPFVVSRLACTLGGLVFSVSWMGVTKHCTCFYNAFLRRVLHSFFEDSGTQEADFT